MIKVNCTGNGASAACDQWLTCGTVGAVCEFSFDSTWDGLRKTAVFTDGNTQRDVLLTENRCVIPWEVLTQAGAKLCVGVYGADAGGEVVVPTIYANVGEIRPGADPSGDESTDPTLPVWAQICSEIGELRDLATAEKNNLVAAINEAAQSGGSGGSGTSDHCQLTNRDAVNQHPISAITGLQGALDSKATETYVNNHHDNTKQDTLTAGENISIVDNVISAASGGGGGGDDESAELEYITSVTVSEEDVNSVEFSLDKDGLPFSLTKFAIVMGATQTPSDFWNYGATSCYTGNSNTRLFINKDELPLDFASFYNIGAHGTASRHYKWFFEKKNGRWFVITAPSGTAWSSSSINDVHAMFSGHAYSKAKEIAINLISSSVYIKPGVTIGLFGIRG